MLVQLPFAKIVVQNGVIIIKTKQGEAEQPQSTGKFNPFLTTHCKDNDYNKMNYKSFYFERSREQALSKRS
jgi:hypothetical protein